MSRYNLVEVVSHPIRHRSVGGPAMRFLGMVVARMPGRLAALVYAVVALLLIQIWVPHLVPASVIYRHRMNYDAVKNNPGPDIDVVLDYVKRNIARNKVDDYLIILGDSVAYSGPGGPEQSLAVHFRDLARSAGSDLVAYNLAMPSMQMGDIYTMILKLKQHGLKTDHLLINILYAGFVERTSPLGSVFWLQHDLALLDPQAYARLASGAKRDLTESLDLSTYFRNRVYPRVPLLRYHDFLQFVAFRRLGLPTGEVSDTRPWTAKPYLPALMQSPDYVWMFSDSPFVWDDTNPQVYFIRKIVQATQGSDVTFFLAPTNQELLAAEVGRAGYRANLTGIDKLFAALPVTYVNCEAELGSELFADHFHLTPSGYRVLAEKLWPSLNRRPQTAEGGR
ncbi:MAG: hypothetical protein ACM3XN_07510 [Chloroflexota bacterium]